MKKFLLLAPLFFNCLVQTQAVRYLDETFSVKVTNGIVYSVAFNEITSKNESLKMDLYEPKNDTETQRPVIIWAHGGAFVQGSRSGMKSQCEYFAKRGYVAVAIDYRLTNQSNQGLGARYAGSDILALVRFLRSKQAIYKLHPDKYTVAGSSAGAIGSLLAAYDDTIHVYNTSNQGFSNEVVACIEVSGAIDDTTKINSSEAELMIVHGIEDTTIPIQAAYMLQARAEHIGLFNDWHYIANQGHGLWNCCKSNILSWAKDFVYSRVIL